MWAGAVHAYLVEEWPSLQILCSESVSVDSLINWTIGSQYLGPLQKNTLSNYTCQCSLYKHSHCKHIRLRLLITLPSK
jgi:hypothetical protein